MKYKSLHSGSHAIAWAATITSVFQVFPTTFKTRRAIAVPRFRVLTVLTATGGHNHKPMKTNEFSKALKKGILSCLFSFVIMFAFAQSEDEEASPTFGIKLDREVVMAIIEGKTYENVTIELKAAKLGHVPSGVKIIAKDTKRAESNSKCNITKLI